MQHRNDVQSSFSTLLNLVGPILYLTSRSPGNGIAGEFKPHHFHFARILRGDSLALSLARHEHYLAAFLNLRPGLQVLELGCGVGGAAVELAKFANVTVVGIDGDADKIFAADVAARNAHISGRVTFKRADPMRPQDLCPIQLFDCVYAIETLKVHATFEASFREIAALLKPGGKFAVYEWCWTSVFNVLNPDHCRLAELVETTSGLRKRAPYERSIEAATAAIHRCGLILDHREDLATRKSEKPWYFPLEVALSDPRISWHPGMDTFGGLSKTAATILLEAGKRQLFTPMALFVGQRPHQRNVRSDNEL